MRPAAPGVLLLMAVAAAGASCRRHSGTAVIGYATEVGFTHIEAYAQRTLTGPSAESDVRLVVAPVRRDSATPGDVRAAIALTAIHGLSGVLGPGSSRGALAAAPIYNEAGIPVVLPTATSRLLRQLGPWTFVLAPDDSVEGEFLARVADERFAARTALIFHTDDEYGTGLRDGVQGALAARGVRVLDVHALSEIRGFCDETGPSDAFRRVVAAALRNGVPDVVIAAVRDENAGCLARTLAELRSLRRILTGDGTQMVPSLFARAGPAADSIYGVTFWHPDRPDSISRHFAEDFQRQSGRPPTAGDAMRFDALGVLVAAVRAVGPDPDAVRGWLEQLGKSLPAYEGVTGPVSFGPGRVPRLLLVRAERERGGPRLLP